MCPSPDDDDQSENLSQHNTNNRTTTNVPRNNSQNESILQTTTTAVVNNDDNSNNPTSAEAEAVIEEKRTIAIYDDNITKKLVSFTDAIMTDKSTTKTTTSSANSSFNSNQCDAVILLCIVALLWGTQTPVTKKILSENNESNVASLTFCRFFIASVVSLIYTPSLRPVFNKCMRSFREEEEDGLVRVVAVTSWEATDGGFFESSDDEDAIKTWMWGVRVGMWMFSGYALQTFGLEFTTAQRSTFLLYLNTNFVPFFAYFIYDRKITLLSWTTASIASLGTILLSYDETPINIGDFCTIGAAASSAMYFTRMEAASMEVKNVLALNAACLWTVTTTTFIWMILLSSITTAIDIRDKEEEPYHHQSTPFRYIGDTLVNHFFEILYLAIVTTTMANTIQANAQGGVTTERAAIIYAMDPVYSAVISHFLLGETLAVQGIVGASLITLAAVSNAVFDFGVGLHTLPNVGVQNR